TLGWLEGKYAVSEAVSLRAAVRGWYDAVFDATDRYLANVERDQKTDLSLREALLTIGHGDLDVRLGRQQIVWGEAISTFVTDVADEFSLGRSEGGFRLSLLRRGWDVSLIYYDQADKSPVFFQRRVAQPPRPDVIVLDPQHPRLHVVGVTLGKSFEPVVVRAEAAYTIGKRYETTDPLDLDGVVRRDTLDWL